MSEARLIELETRQAFQDDNLAALNTVLIEQQRQIERLQLQVQALARRLAELQTPEGLLADEAPPPHY